MAIAGNDVLFNLIGTTYGGDGQVTFGLPDLRSRVPLHQGNNFVIGQKGGEETITLNTGQIPSHTHVPQGVSAIGNSANPANNVWAELSGVNAYGTPANSSMSAATSGSTGGNQPHDNMIPFLAVNLIIALLGIFPSQN